MLYIFFLPFALVDTLGWLVAPVVTLVSFTLFGIEAIGAEIENPCKFSFSIKIKSKCNNDFNSWL